MAKKVKNISTTEAWLSDMENKFPVAVKSFLNLLHHWGYETLGHAFGRIAESGPVFEIFLSSNNVILIDDESKNLEALKKALEKGLEKSEKLASELAWAA